MNHPKDLHSFKKHFSCKQIRVTMTTCSIIVGHDVFKRINCCSHSLFINLFPAQGKTRPSQKDGLIFRCFSISFRKGPEASQKNQLQAPQIHHWVRGFPTHSATRKPLIFKNFGVSGKSFLPTGHKWILGI